MAAPGLIPCELLNSAEIESVQGEPIVEAKPTARAEGPYAVSQCYFVLKTITNSVVLTITQKGADGGDLREFWGDTFHEKKDEEKGREEEEKTPPLKVAGVGDEAYWTGSALSGALYVLSGDVFFRLSVGGVPDRETNIARSKKLALIVLRRLKSQVPHKRG